MSHNNHDPVPRNTQHETDVNIRRRQLLWPEFNHHSNDYDGQVFVEKIWNLFLIVLILWTKLAHARTHEKQAHIYRILMRDRKSACNLQQA